MKHYGVLDDANLLTMSEFAALDEESVTSLHRRVYFFRRVGLRGWELWSTRGITVNSVRFMKNYDGLITSDSPSLK